jgi:hypothetical protein
MIFYGLHFVGDDKVPVQVRISTSNQQIWARSAPNGEWTECRRLDVIRNLDGTLAEEVTEATHAKSADAAGRLKNQVKITFSGDVSGSVSFDGSASVACALSIAGLGSLSSRISSLEDRINNLGTGRNTNYGSS